MLKQNFKLSIWGMIAAFAALPAVGADPNGWFFGIQLAPSETKLDLPGLGFTAREEKNAYRLFAGYQFTPRLKAELNYLDMTKPSLTYNSLGVMVPQEGKGKGLRLVGTANVPLTEKFGLYGKLGAFHSNLEGGCATDLLNCGAADRGTDVSYGMGLRYDFTKTVSVRGEWERFHRLGGREAWGEADRDFFSVGLGFKF